MVLGRRSVTGKIDLIWSLVLLSTLLLKRVANFWKFGI